MTRLETLRTAVRCAIRNGCPRKTISVPGWASTFGVTQKLVREVWEQELTKIPPSLDSIGDDGK